MQYQKSIYPLFALFFITVVIIVMALLINGPLLFDVQSIEAREGPVPLWQEPKIDSYTLIDAESDQVIGFLNDGDVLNLATLPSRFLNIEANVSGSGIESVRFELNDNIMFHIENVAPYTLVGDLLPDYYAWRPEVRSYRLQAIPYTQPNGMGGAGTGLTINFDVIDDPNFGSETPIPTSTPTPSRTPSADPVTALVVYQDRLASGWEEDGAAKRTNSSSSSTVYRGDHAYEAAFFESTGNLYLRLEDGLPISAAQFSGVKFWIHGGEGGQVVDFTIVEPDYFFDRHRIEIGPLSNRWEEVIIPFYQYDNLESIYGLGWLNGQGDEVPTFYLDEIELLEGGFPTPTPTATSTATPIPPTPTRSIFYAYVPYIDERIYVLPTSTPRAALPTAVPPTPTATPACLDQDVEDGPITNDQSATALTLGPICLGKTLNGTMERGDVDVYLLDVETASLFDIELRMIDSADNFVLSLYGAADRELIAHDGSSQPVKRFSRRLDTGQYFMIVNFESGSGAYALQVTDN